MKNTLIYVLAALSLTGCGTVVNGYVAAAESNIATDALKAELNQANAATFTACQTPLYVLPYLTGSQRSGFKALCVPTDANVETGNMVNTTAPALPAPK
jgi:uncharacterized protein YceK